MSVIEDITQKGIYFYHPSKWRTDDKEVKELVDLGLINDLGDELNNPHEDNNCYIYVAKGNPLHFQSGGEKQ
jgi:hypothetical protein